MLNNQTIAVVVPAYNEETQIGRVIETMPAFVDRIVIVNDCSADKTEKVVRDYIAKDTTETLAIADILDDISPTDYNYADYLAQEQMKAEKTLFTPSEVINQAPQNERIILINHLKNGGVGAAIASGYKWCKDHGIDCTAVMAGDGQMDPAELESICEPVVNDGVDYVKGNRLIHRSSWLVIPKARYMGNSILSILTKIASGYWHVSDTQTGYTAISKNALNSIRIDKIYKSYGMPNDMLVKLNIAFCSVKEVPIKPVYNVGEKSKMNILKVIPRVSWLLILSFFKRLWIKYLFRDFHPLFLLYNLSFAMFAGCLPLGIMFIPKILRAGDFIANNNLIIFVFLFISGLQSFLFAMWMDIQDNERLYK